ncbi:60S acidic ribosomal protein P2 [Podila epicladia]|nr:60S acidic ribosomal protein P2 [Podila epicladia]
MKYIAAYHLLTIGGNAAPTAMDIIALLATVGIAAEFERVEAVVALLAGKDVDEVPPSSHPFHPVMPLTSSFLDLLEAPVGKVRVNGKDGVNMVSTNGYYFDAMSKSGAV